MTEPEEFPLRLMASIERVEHAVDEQEHALAAAVTRLESSIREQGQTTRAALSSLRTLVLQHYHAVQSRLDEHARDLRDLRRHLGLAPLPPSNPPSVPPGAGL